VPLTQAALAEARRLDEPLGPPLAAYLEEHVDEELGHDETLLGDLALLGLDRETVRGRIPSPAVAKGRSAASASHRASPAWSSTSGRR